MKTLKHHREKWKREIENGKTFHVQYVAQAGLKITVYFSITNAKLQLCSQNAKLSVFIMTKCIEILCEEFHQSMRIFDNSLKRVIILL